MINSARLTGSLMTPLWVFGELISIKNTHVQRRVCVVYLRFQQILIFVLILFDDYVCVQCKTAFEYIYAFVVRRAGCIRVCVCARKR